MSWINIDTAENNVYNRIVLIMIYYIINYYYIIIIGR